MLWVVTTTPLPSFNWSLTFQVPGSSPIDATTKLTGKDTLAPTFVTTDAGVYRVKLAAGGKSAEVLINSKLIPPSGLWVSIGPGNIGGHIATIAVDPLTKAIYAGAQTGGVWKSGDAGASWMSLTDNTLASLKIRTLALIRPGSAVTDPLTIYAGTGKGIFQSSDEGNTWRASGNPLCADTDITQSSINRIITHPSRSDVLYAATKIGVFKTTDSGNCWTRILSGEVSDIVITNGSAPIVFAGIWNKGIYQALDSNPTVWTLLNSISNSGLPPPDPSFSGFLNVSQGDKRLMITAGDLAAGVPPANTIVKAGDADLSSPPRSLKRFNCREYNGDANANGVFDSNEVIYRHTTPDCGPFSVIVGDLRLTGLRAGTTVAAGDTDVGMGLSFIHVGEQHTNVDGNDTFDIGESIYRDSGFGMVTLATSASSPDTAYATFEPEPYQVYKTVDGGRSWKETAAAPHRCDSNQCSGYNNVIAVDPSFPNTVYIGQVHLFVSVDGGDSWKDISGPNTDTSQPGAFVHDDQHAIAFDPSDSKRVYNGNDGGISQHVINRADPKSNWVSLNNSIVTTQFYDFDSSPSEPFDVAGGLQDNGVLRRGSAREWNTIAGGDGYRTAFDAGSTMLSPIIYYDQYWGRPDIGIQRFSAGGRLGSGPFFASPFRRGILLNTNIDLDTSGGPISGKTGQMFLAKDADTAVPATWNCIDPTPLNKADSVSFVAFARPASPATTEDSYYLGMSDGSIYLVRVPIGSTVTRPDCTLPEIPGFSSTKIFPPALPAPNCAVPVAAVAGIALDPFDPSVIYATFNGRGKGRVLRLKKRTDGSFCGQDITGVFDPTGGSPLPPGLLARGVVVDELDPLS